MRAAVLRQNHRGAGSAGGPGEIGHDRENLGPVVLGTVDQTVLDVDDDERCLAHRTHCGMTDRQPEPFLSAAVASAAVGRARRGVIVLGARERTE